MKKQFGDLFILSDLLSNSKIGDVLWLGSEGKIVPIEIKDGEVNKRILAAIKEKNEGNKKEYDSLIINPRYKNQVSRIERQTLKFLHEKNLYFDEVSLTDNVFYRIITDTSLKIQTYDNKLIELLSILDSKFEGYLEVDDCLFLLGTRVEEADPVWLSKKISALGLGEDKKIINFFSKTVNESPMAKPILSLEMSSDLKFKMLESNFLVVQIFLPEVFCRKYSNDSINFVYNERQGNVFISMHDANSSAYSILGEGSLQRLFDFLQTPGTVCITSKKSFEELYDLNSNKEKKDTLAKLLSQK